MRISPRTNVEYAIREVSVWAKGVPGDKIFLNIGDPGKYDFEVPQHVKDAMVDAVRAGKSYYADSQGEDAVLKAIAARERGVSGREPDHSIVTTGVAESINFLLASLVEPGSNVLLPSPCYPQYLAMARFYGGEPREYACAESDAWNPDADDLRKKVDKNTRAIVVINPNNPTGAVYSKKKLQSIADIAGENNIPLISDEIYDMLTFGDYTPLSRVAKDVPLVAMNGLSKNYLATGWRVGYSSFYGCEELFEACMKLARVRLCASTPASLALIAAYSGNDAHLKEVREKLVKRRDLVVKRLNEMGLHCEQPQGAFYAFPQCPQDDRAFVRALIDKERVVTVFGSGFGQGGAGHLRVVFLPKEEVLSEACDRIERFVSTWKVF